MTRRRETALVLAAAVLPRLGVLLLERGDILASFTEKSDDFARTFVESGTFGFIPGEPSAYTQPLYGFFLVPLYAIERHWALVGIAQIVVAALTALAVRAIGDRWLGRPHGLVAALVATLSPYLVWHDVHVNREILDGLLAAGLVLGTTLLVERPTLRRGIATGAVAGLAVLGNTRLVPLVAVAAGFVLWLCGRKAIAPTAALVAAATLVVVPWAARNAASVGCFTITTDARALWKANNTATYGVLSGGGWIDDVPSPPGAPLTAEMAGAVYRDTGVVRQIDECAQMRYYSGLTRTFWREHPGEKARLMAQATWMTWDPRVTPATERSPGAGTWQDTARAWVVPVYMIAILAAGALGLRRLPRRWAVLVIALLAMTTLTAMVFAGATRYRAPWDFLLALAAAPALAHLVRRRGGRR